MSDMIREYRTIDIRCDRANDMIPPIFASTGDDNGRILRVVLTDNGENVEASEKLHAQLLVNPSPYDSDSFGDLVDMTPVSGETATFEVSIPAGAVSKPGLKRMGIAFLLDNDDGTQDIVCSRPFTVNVEQGVLRIESDSAIGAFEAAVRQAVASASAAKDSETKSAEYEESAQRAAENADDSARQASTDAQNAKTSETNAKNAEAASLRYAETAQSHALAASENAESAKTSENNAAASAMAAQQAVDGFGLEAGTTTTGEPGTEASVEITKDGTKYKANFTIPRGADGKDVDSGSGEMQTVTVSEPLTGNGTADSPLGIGMIPIGKGGTGSSDVKEAGRNLFKGNIDASGGNINDSSKMLIYQSGAQDPQSVFAYKLGSSVWGYIQSKIETAYPDITQLVNLVAKVQALEAAKNPVELDEGADISSIINTSGTYIKLYGKTAVNGPTEDYNKAGSKYVITVINSYGDAYQKIEPIAGVSDIYYRTKDAVAIGPWHKVSATEQ